MIIDNIFPDDGNMRSITFDQSLLGMLSSNGNPFREFTKEEYDNMTSKQLRALADATEIYERSLEESK